MNKAYWTYHQKLIHLINRGGSTKGELFFSLLGINSAAVNKAKAIINNYYKEERSESTLNEKTYQIQLYQGTNQYVLDLMNELNSSNVKSDLLGAYLHGSLATNEEIDYSDFDALVILKDSAFKNPIQLAKVCKKLNQFSQFFYKHDPLQHHGWFVLTERMLDETSSTYFPPVLFEKCKSLLENQGNKIQLRVTNQKNIDFEQPFYQLATALKAHLKSGLAGKNAFVLKSIFSQFMLLPALFEQAMTRQGIDKKQSFKIAPEQFEEAEWEIMNLVSSIRTDWSYELTAWQRFWLTNPNYVIRKWGRRYAPNLNDKLMKQVNSISTSDMLSLIVLMEEKLGGK